MKFSIITINYNNKTGLEKTLRSVRNQSVQNFEYIVIDGASTDGSVALLEENDDIIDVCVSEPDRGIYNAMNKGVERATGEYCLFLNSGDLFHDAEVMRRMGEVDSDADILFGKVENFFPDGRKEIYSPRSEMTLMWIIRTGIHHAGSFIKTELMRIHPYDESLKICADRKFFVEALVIDNCSFQTLDFIVSDFEMGGISNTQTGLTKKEYWQIMNELFPPRLVEDYMRSDERIQEMTSMLVKCRYKVISLICKLDIFIIKIFRLILGSKLDR